MLLCNYVCRLSITSIPTKDGTKLNVYSKFEPFFGDSILYSIICSYINEYRSNIFIHVRHHQIGIRRSYQVNYKNDNKQPPNYFSHIVYTLGYKIKSLTLLKQINFTKQTCTKLAGNAISSPSVAFTRSSMITMVLKYRYCAERSFVSSVELRT